MNYCAQGVWQRGYPSVDNHGLVLRLTTYEFLPYPMALCGLVFGWHGWAVRIPAMLFGTFTAWNIGRMGRDLFSPFIGLLTAFVYTIIPLEVYFAAHCIHPQQTQFFMLLCIWAFYRANRKVGVLESKDFYKACVFFCCGYLSWEGSAFVLPALAVSLIFLHPGRFQWLRQFHLYADSSPSRPSLLRSWSTGPRRRKATARSASASPIFRRAPSSWSKPQDRLLHVGDHARAVPPAARSGTDPRIFLHRAQPAAALRRVDFLHVAFGYSNFLPVYTNRYFYFISRCSYSAAAPVFAPR